MPFQFQGETFNAVTHEQMTPGEIDAVERVAQMTWQKIQRHAKTCVCDHPMQLHAHRDPEGNPLEDTSCADETCDCDSFTSDLPARVNYALIWVSLKRVKPEVTYDQIASVPQAEVRYVPEVVDENPTQPSLVE